MLKTEGKKIPQIFLKINFCNLCTCLQFFLITQLSLSPHLLLLILADPAVDLPMYLITTYMQIFYIFIHTIDAQGIDTLRVKISQVFAMKF